MKEGIRLDKKTKNILIGLGAAAVAGISMFGARKINEQICKNENEKTRIKEVTDIGHLNEVEFEVIRIRTKPAIMIRCDGSIFLFLDRIDNKKGTMMEIERFLNGRGVRKDTFKGIITAEYTKGKNDIYVEENPELINMDENSILYNKPVFLTSDAKSVDFGIPIKVGRSVMISAGMASTGPIAFPVAIGKKLIRQGLILNVRDKGMVLLTVDSGKHLVTTIQQMFSFCNSFHSVILLNDEGGDMNILGRAVRKSADLMNAGMQSLKQQLGRPIIDKSVKEESELLHEVIEHGVILCGSHGYTSTMEYKEIFGEEVQVVRFTEKFSV